MTLKWWFKQLYSLNNTGFDKKQYYYGLKSYKINTPHIWALKPF